MPINIMKQVPRALIIIILFLTAFGIGLTLRSAFTRNRPFPINERPAEPPKLPSPEVTGQPQYIVSRRQTFPSSVPAYTIIKKADTEIVTKTVGGALGLQGSPTPLVGSQGVSFYWNTKTRSLTVGGDPINIAYSEDVGLSDTIRATEDELSRAAVSYLTRLGIPPSPFFLKKTGSVYMRPEQQDPRPVASASAATLIQMSFQYTIDGFPVFVNPPSVPGAEVSVNGKGEVGSFRAFWFPTITKESEKNTIVSYDEAVRRLLSFQGVLASVETEGGTSEVLLTRPPDISTIYQVELGYFYSPDQQSLSPVFVFYGKGVQNSLTLKTITLVSAAPGEPPLKTVP